MADLQSLQSWIDLHNRIQALVQYFQDRKPDDRGNFSPTAMNEFFPHVMKLVQESRSLDRGLSESISDVWKILSSEMQTQGMVTNLTVKNAVDRIRSIGDMVADKTRARVAGRVVDPARLTNKEIQTLCRVFPGMRRNEALIAVRRLGITEPEPMLNRLVEKGLLNPDWDITPAGATAFGIVFTVLSLQGDEYIEGRSTLQRMLNQKGIPSTGVILDFLDNRGLLQEEYHIGEQSRGFYVEEVEYDTLALTEDGEKYADVLMRLLGSSKAKDFILKRRASKKYAKNLPKDVERYVKETKEAQPGKDESYYWAVAWSRYCVAGDSYIATSMGLMTVAAFAAQATGRLVVHGDGVVAQEIVARIPTHEGEANTSHVINTGIKSVVRVDAKHGFSLTCTPDHRILVLNPDNYSTEWVQAAESEGRLAVLPSSGVWGKSTRLPEFKYTSRVWNNVVPLRKPSLMSYDLARVLGYLVSEGSITEEGIEFSNTNPQVVEDYARCMTSLFGESPKISWSEPNLAQRRVLRSAKVRSRTRWYQEFFASLGLTVSTAHYKQVPHVILNAPRKFVKEFLRGFIEGDGYCGDALHQNRVDLSTSSEILAKQLHLILANLGIGSTLSEDQRGYFNVRVHSAPMVARFVDLVGGGVFKKVALSSLRRRERGSEFSMVPAQAILSLDKGILNSFPNSGRISLSRLQRDWAVLEKYASGSPILSNLRDLMDKGYMLDEITKVTPAGETEVFDISVPGDHSFVVNGLIAHNCQYQNPDSPHCKQDSYFPGREKKASLSVEAFREALEGAFRKHFPKGYFRTGLKTEGDIFIESALLPKGMQTNNIIHNDPLYQHHWIDGAVVNGELAPKFKIRRTMGSMLTGRNFSKPEKTGWRDFTATPEATVKKFDAYFKHVRDMVNARDDLDYILKQAASSKVAVTEDTAQFVRWVLNRDRVLRPDEVQEFVTQIVGHGPEDATLTKRNLGNLTVGETVKVDKHSNINELNVEECEKYHDQEGTVTRVNMKGVTVAFKDGSRVEFDGWKPGKQTGLYRWTPKEVYQEHAVEKKVLVEIVYLRGGQDMPPRRDVEALDAYIERGLERGEERTRVYFTGYIGKFALNQKGQVYFTLSSQQRDRPTTFNPFVGEVLYIGKAGKRPGGYKGE